MLNSECPMSKFFILLHSLFEIGYSIFSFFHFVIRKSIFIAPYRRLPPPPPLLPLPLLLMPLPLLRLELLDRSKSRVLWLPRSRAL
jgi:hypothetical protein